jgi:hypothetical protein
VDFEGCVNPGSGFGAVQHNFMIEDMIKVYEKEHFVNKDGSLNLKPCQHYQNPIIKKYGFEIKQADIVLSKISIKAEYRCT